MYCEPHIRPSEEPVVKPRPLDSIIFWVLKKFGKVEVKTTITPNPRLPSLIERGEEILFRNQVATQRNEFKRLYAECQATAVSIDQLDKLKAEDPAYTTHLFIMANAANDMVEALESAVDDFENVTFPDSPRKIHQWSDLIYKEYIFQMATQLDHLRYYEQKMRENILALEHKDEP